MLRRMPDSQPPADAAAAPSPPPVSGGLYVVAALVLIALVFGGWGLWQVFAGDGGRSAPAQVQALQRQVDALQQRNATLSRSDQITRDANRDLQGALAERDEEIAGLRADVAFYERFVGSTSQRRGLAVHELRLQPQTEQAWHFTATLTQNVNRGALNSGRLQILVEGTRGGALRRIGWAELRQQANEPGMPYSFKYFQQVEGDLVLPEGFQPVRVIARLVPVNGAAIEQSFTWTAAVGKEGAGGA
jgi:cell division protein FtsB